MAMLGLSGIVGAAELATLVAAPPVGAVLIPSSALLGYFVRRSRKLDRAESKRAVEDAVEQQARIFYLDTETGLPNRQHLLDELARGIARAERYSHDVTLAVVEVMRIRDLDAAWGPGAVHKATAHVAETLRRITRASDFLARLDGSRFAIALTQCTAEQAAGLGDRIALAVANRPLPCDERMRVPVYVNVEVTALQYDWERFRGPMEFLSAAGGEASRGPSQRGHAVPGSRSSGDVRDLRRQLVKDYDGGTDAEEFAAAYARNRSARAG